MPNVVFFFWNCDELLWINSPSASFQSCLPGLPDTQSCKTSHFLRDLRTRFLFIVAAKKKKKKSDSNWRSSVSFFKTPECYGRLYLSSWLTEFLSQVGGAPQQGVGLSVFLSDQRGSLSHWYLNNVTLRGSFGQCFFFILHFEFYTHHIIAKCGFLVCVDFSYPNHIHVTAVAPLFGMSPAFCLGWSRGRLLVFWITVFCVVFTLLHVCFECLHANFPPAAVLCRRMQNVIHIT